MNQSKAMLLGALGFAIVSLAAFSVWSFGGRWLSERFGEAGMYAAVAAVFIGLSGVVLGPLAGSRPRFYIAFVPAFAVYAIVWSACWMGLRSKGGEWLGSAAGMAAFAAVAGALLGGFRSIPRAAVVLFVAHSAGYFMGGEFYYATKKSSAPLAQLGWGVIYGLGFGAGLGYAFPLLRRPKEPVS